MATGAPIAVFFAAVAFATSGVAEAFEPVRIRVVGEYASDSVAPSNVSALPGVISAIGPGTRLALSWVYVAGDNDGIATGRQTFRWRLLEHTASLDDAALVVPPPVWLILGRVGTTEGTVVDEFYLAVDLAEQNFPGLVQMRSAFVQLTLSAADGDLSAPWWNEAFPYWDTAFPAPTPSALAAAFGGRDPRTFLLSFTGSTVPGVMTTRVAEFSLVDLRFEPAGCNAADVAVPFGDLDVNDVVEFVNGFIAGSAIADVTGPSGSIDVNDVIAFVSGFTPGCP